MDSRFSEYLRKILASDVVIQRVDTLLETFKPFFPDDIIKDIFVEDYLNKAKEHEYLSLYLFTDNYQIEFSNFLHKDEMSIYRIKKSVDFLTIENENYDFIQTNSQSELTVSYSLGVIIEYDLHATGKNCEFLKNIANQYIKSNIF